MPDRETMIAAVKMHIHGESTGDREGWLKIFAEDIVIEDPVGSGGIYRGIAVVGTTFWGQAQRAGAKLQLLEDVIVCGNEAVAILKAEIGPADSRRTLSPIIGHFTFNEAGKVAGLRAFFDY